MNEKRVINLKYVPHGINQEHFFPIQEGNAEHWTKFQDFKKALLGQNEYEYVVLYNARNIRRKSVPDLILGYKEFCEKIGKEKAKKCCLLLHTQPIDENGTDLYAVRDLICDPEYVNVVFSDHRLGVHEMNYLYNLADVTALVSSNEGWGLSLTESMLSGRMIIANTSGGMQDQMRFENEEGDWIDFDENFCSNHFGTYKKHGKWAVPVFPSNMSLVGSVPTPYIFDDRADFRDIAQAIENVYNLSKEERLEKGLAGREWAMSEEAKMTAAHICNNVISAIDTTIETFTPRKPFELIKVQDLPRKAIRHKLTY